MGISRRMMLRGAGVSLALPWLESVPVWGASQSFPKRFAVLFMGNGINANHWWARGAGKEMQLGKSLQPLEPVKTKMNFISGLFNKPTTGIGIHPGMTGGLLAGCSPLKGSVLRAGTSLDQILAERIGRDTVQPSLVLGCEQPNTGFHETNFSLAYSSHISWQTPRSPVPLELYPALAFDSLFQNRRGRRLSSILDAVRDDTTALSKKARPSDRAKLDEYLTSVREVEKRVEPLRQREDRPPRPLTMERPAPGLPQDLREHMKLMGDIIALGFQTDSTRVASLLLCRDLSDLYYPFLAVKDGHHSISHRDLSDDYERVTRFHVSQVAYIASRLEAMKEGEGTVLDNSCVLFLSNMWAGWKHDNTRLPVLTVGGLAGTLQTGRVLDYYGKGDDDRKLASLFLSIMDRMGVTLPRFGDADRRLAGF